MNPAAILTLMAGGLELWQKANDLRGTAQLTLEKAQALPASDAAGAVAAIATAANEYPQLYKAAAAFLAEHDRWAGKRKVPQALQDARADLFRELAESYSALTGTPIPAEVKAQWGG